MTRLTNNDVSPISSHLKEYDQKLCTMTDHTLLGIACHAYGVDEKKIKQAMKFFDIQVVPITAGQGIITDFSETVCVILKFLGFNAAVTPEPDVNGLCLAYENKADAVMMADDFRFIAINLHTRKVTDNSDATGLVFASALDLLANGLKDKKTTVLGCGPVGESAARNLLSSGAKVSLFDPDQTAACSLEKKLAAEFKNPKILIEKDIHAALSGNPFVLEATPSNLSIPDELISGLKGMAAPGVPLGISQNAARVLKDRFIHDKLELGVAAMAVSLLL
ncbi:MAG: 3-methylornithyl-N6-L-lysine dehydrogenase PylD [Desulfobacteraceae bacterium]|nr:3-methylornithyl-N6-L-lysine dehydrogenase PylD [Desulfobacteraceae bacterium]